MFITFGPGFRLGPSVGQTSFALAYAEHGGSQGLELNVTRNPKMAKFYLDDLQAEIFNDAAKVEQPDLN